MPRRCPMLGVTSLPWGCFSGTATGAVSTRSVCRRQGPRAIQASDSCLRGRYRAYVLRMPHVGPGPSSGAVAPQRELANAPLHDPASSAGLGLRWRVPFTVGVVLIGLPALVALFYVASVHSLAGDSDGATVVLEGQAMSGGHVMLHGWALSLDSFWS